MDLEEILNEIMAKISMDLKTKVNSFENFGMTEPNAYMHDNIIKSC